MSFEDRIGRGDVVILDGAMGTELQLRGVPMHGVAWSAAALLSHPRMVRAIHEDHIRAGAEVVITNTFAAGRRVLEPAGLGDRVAEANRAAVAAAREARDSAASGRPVWIAGSMSSFVAGDAAAHAGSGAEARRSYREQASLLAEAGADLIALEMMDGTEDSIWAVEAAAATGLPVWVGFSCVLAGEDGAVVMRHGDAAPFAAVVAPVMAAGGALAGVMHSDVEAVTPALDVLFAQWPGPVAAYPHSGHFVMPDWQFVDLISPEAFVAEAEAWVARGVAVVGGCCGIGTDHVRLLAERLSGRPVGSAVD